MAGEQFAAVEARGLDEIIAGLRAIDRTLPSKIVPAALKRAGERGGYIQAAEAEAASSFKDPSGATRKTIRVLATQRKVRLVAGSRRVYWVPIVYFGTDRIEANPWLDRAIAARGTAPAVREAGAELSRALRAVQLNPVF